MSEPTGTALTTDPEDEYEYEYEYSTTETESVYIHIDLSSVNDVLKSSNATDRKSLKALQTPKSNKKADRGKGKEREQDVELNVDGQGDQNADEADEGDLQAEIDPRSPENNTGNPTTVEIGGSGDSIQILELHSENPIISYRNQIYTCVWTDMIGTNMFFTKHNETPIHEPEIATEDYDLLGTSRIKLVGYKARITAKDQSQYPASRRQTQKGRQNDVTNGTSTSISTPTIDVEEEEDQVNDNDDDEYEEVEGADEDRRNVDISEYIPSNYSTTTLRRTDPQVQSHMKRQATFLEKLKDIKKLRGERDKVRTFVDRHTMEADEKRKQETSQMRTEIEGLNARVVRGDHQALQRLQEIYARIEEVGSDDDEGQGPS